MGIRDYRTILIITAVLTSQSNAIEEQSDTCVWVGVEVNFDYGHNSSVLTCEAPEKPLNGGYASESDGDRYNAGDTVTYYCNQGHQLIGQVNRTCNGTPSGWEPEQPYCEPEYIGHLMTRLSGIEDQMKVIEQRITAFENNNSQIGHYIKVMANTMSAIDNKVTTTDNVVSTINNKVTTTDNMVSILNSKVSSIENNVSAIHRISIKELLNFQVDISRLLSCTDITKVLNQDSLTKCMTMQSGLRKGLSVSVYTWVIDDYNNKVAKGGGYQYSQPFYHTVPGYKFRLRGNIHRDSGTYIYLQLLPGEYDDQLKWPFSQTYNVTVLTNNGHEVLHKFFPGDQSTCHEDRPTYMTLSFTVTLLLLTGMMFGRTRSTS